MKINEIKDTLYEPQMHLYDSLIKYIFGVRFFLHRTKYKSTGVEITLIFKRYYL